MFDSGNQGQEGSGRVIFTNDMPSFVTQMQRSVKTESIVSRHKTCS